MVDENKAQSETLYSQVINKLSKNGRVVGSMAVETKIFDNYKFIQLTQDKSAFGNQPAKRSWVTIDPSNEEIKKAISEAYKK